MKIRGTPSPLHPGVPLRQGQPVPRPRLLLRSYPPSPKRVGRKGEGRFEQSLLGRGARDHRRELQARSPKAARSRSFPYSYAGNSGMIHYGSLDRRFFGSIGASATRTICATAGFEGYKAVMGATIGFDPEKVNAKLMIRSSRGAPTSFSSNVHFWPFVEEAPEEGLASSSSSIPGRGPQRRPTAHRPARHRRMPSPPRHDACARFRDGLIDEDYVSKFTVGVEGLRESDGMTPRAPPWRRASRPTSSKTRPRWYGTYRPAAIRITMA